MHTDLCDELVETVVYRPLPVDIVQLIPHAQRVIRPSMPTTIGSVLDEHLGAQTTAGDIDPSDDLNWITERGRHD
jgi:hypothetical protein